MAYKVVSYITAKTDEVFPENLDLTGITHVNFGFAFLREMDGEHKVWVRRPECLKSLQKVCKAQGVKLLVSLQQWGGQRFDEWSRTQKERENVARQVAQMVEEFQLDGIDVDWEYPGYNLRLGTEIENFKDEYYILFMQALREVLPGKLLTIAHGGEARYYKHTDFTALSKILDFINLMGYDYNWKTLGSSHHSNLYPGSVGQAAAEGSPLNDDAAVRYYLSQGVLPEQINIGVPYYGYVKDGGPEGFFRFDQAEELLEKGFLETTAFDPTVGVPEELAPTVLKHAKPDGARYERCFDEKAQQSYITRNGEFYVAYDDERTLKAKCDYIKENGLGGLMNWDYNHDPKGQARAIVARELEI